jgi:hypothetical protein
MLFMGQLHHQLKEKRVKTIRNKHILQQTTQYTIDINDGDDDKAHTALNRAFTSFPISEKARKKGRVG